MTASHHIKFTESAIEWIPPPASGRETYWDMLLPGFGLRVSPPRASGYICKTYVAMYWVRGLGKQVFETIGPATLIKLEDARNIARASMLKALGGVNPAAEKRRAKWPRSNVRANVAEDASRLFPAVVDRFIPEYRKGRKKNGKPRRARTVALAKGRLNGMKDWQPYTMVDDVKVNDGTNWSLKYVDDFTKDDVKNYCKIKGSEGFPVAANRNLSTLSSFFKWCVDEKLIPFNPAADLPPLFPETSRERWLSDIEIRAFWWACDQMGYPYGPEYQLILLTATRVMEVGELPVKGELGKDDDRVWTLPAERTKPAQTLLIYLTDMMLDILDRIPRDANSKYLFVGGRGALAQGHNDAKKQLDVLMTTYLRRKGHLAKDEELKPWVTHDLRHTARTNFSKLKVPPDIAERLLNHKILGMRKVYDHWEFFDEKKDALEKWSDLVKKIISIK